MTESRTRRQKMQRKRGLCRQRPNFVPMDVAFRGNITPWQFISRTLPTLEAAVRYFDERGAPGLRVLYHPGITYVLQHGKTLAAVPAATWQMALAAALNNSPELFPTKEGKP